MKKKKDLDINFKYPVILYREDLLEIQQILLEDLKAKNLNISFDEYEANKIEEIPADTKTTTQIRMSSYSPSITFAIRSYSNSITTYSDSLEIEGAMQRIYNILNKNSRAFIYGVFRIFNFFSIVVYISLVLLISTSKVDKYFSSEGQIFLLIALFLSSIVVVRLLFNPIVSIINFGTKKETPNFWIKNKDQILVGIIIAVFGLIAGYFIPR